ncbi:MAG: glycosyltransferase [Candidatus Dormibacteria bacterium]
MNPHAGLLSVLVDLACSSGACTALAVLPRLIRARRGLSLIPTAVALATGGWATFWLTGQLPLAVGAGLGLLMLGGLSFLWLRGWTWLGRVLWLSAALAAAAYVSYSAQQTAAQAVVPRLEVAVLVGSVVLILGEIAALGLALSYLFEIVDVLGRPVEPPARPPAWPDERPWPLVVLQVPTYNEPVELVAETLRALGRLDYPRFLVQVVDNNTTDEAVWRPLEALCQELGKRFAFIHLSPWPGFKAGALNEATRRLPEEVEVVGIVDADYLVRPGWLRQTIPYFIDPSVGFVQTPQHYRDWHDDSYLRGLFHSYRYFFDITMPARAHRDAIIFCGTMGLIRRSVLDEIGGWNEDCITEDAEASLRMLGRGYRGVYHHVAWGEGLMPLTFDGLKKQRFRWALGGIQILRQHWRELLPFTPHQLRLTRAQRWHYLLGAVQWFSDLLMAAFTLLLLATAAATAAHHRLPVREITGAVLVIPLVFLGFGLLRASWAMRRSGGLSWGDALRALRVWFALSWTVALADLRGLLTSKAIFLRTPKRRSGLGNVRQALRSARPETALAVAAVAAAVAMEARAFSITATLLALLLLFQAAVYLSAPWASLATEGIRITPLRQIYLRSAQNLSEPVEAHSHAARLPVALALLAAGGLIVAFATSSPTAPAPFVAKGPAVDSTPSGTPSPSASPSPAVSPSPSASATTSPLPSPSASATPSAGATTPPPPSPTP